MTSGTDLQDLRVDVFASFQHNYIGTYWKRTWSGADRPKPARVVPGYHDVVDQWGATRIFNHLPTRKRRDGSEEHSYSMTLVSYFNPLGGYRGSVNTAPGPNDPYHQTGFVESFGGATWSSRWTSNDDIALIGKLRELIIGSDFDPSVFVAEGGESLKTILHAATAISGAITAAKRGDFRKAGRSLASYKGNSKKAAAKAVASNWLEFQYGVLPLLNDVYNAARTLAHLTSVPFSKTYTVTRKVTSLPGAASPSNFSVSGSGYERVKIKAILLEANIVGILGLTDPATVVWEKLPYSFVVDWFVPIGNYLQARGLAQNLKGTFVTSRTKRWEAHSPKPKGKLQAQGFDTYRHRAVELTRTVSITLSVPTPCVKPLSKVASWQHAANAVALVTNLAR